MVIFGLSLQACQLNYLLKSGYNQALILKARQPIDRALLDPSIPEEFKRKLRLTKEAKQFAETRLHLKQTRNYESFVMLDRDAVTWAVSAAPRFELSAYLWSFPVIGKVPYKGFFSIEEAHDEAKILEQQGYDTYVRGVSAYSTLGWFDDPLLSSMLKMRDVDLVDTIIHETTHATVFVKSRADFNERLATFVGMVGAEKFYFEKEGPDSETVKHLRLENEDGKKFSAFFTVELKVLDEIYRKLRDPSSTLSDAQKISAKQSGLKAMVDRFQRDVVPSMQTSAYKEILRGSPNNARLISLKTYYQDLSDFEAAYEKFDRDFSKLLEFCKSLAKSDDPEKDLKLVTQK
jgi:predicted aminopeptidase